MVIAGQGQMYNRPAGVVTPAPNEFLVECPVAQPAEPIPPACLVEASVER